jgi:hypothetical protein
MTHKKIYLTTPLSKVNFDWMSDLAKLRGMPEYELIINVFLKDHLNYKPEISTMTIRKAVKMGKKIKVVRQEHPGWLEWQRMRSPKDANKNVLLQNEVLSKIYTHKKDGPFGRFQYTYHSSKGIISLIRLNNYSLDKKDTWEIFAYGNTALFEDVLRFDTKSKAEKFIRRMLR